MSSDDHGASTTRENGREGGWQGRRASVSYTAPQYRWQGGGGAGVERKVSLPRRRRRWWIVFWLVLLWGLYGVYVGLLAYAPRRVPLVVAVATSYDLPLPPNAWAQEDLELIGRLNEVENKTLRLLDTSPSWKSRSAGLAAWEQSIKDLIRQGSASHVALFYISMYGAADERGRACLIPPGVAPLDSQQWIPVEDMLRQLQRLPEGWQKIVFLDASRQSNNWQIGVVENTFADRLPDAVHAAGVRNLCVINSAGPEQINWASPDLGGSNFGRHVAFGLAGAADFKSTNPNREAGNGDGRVTLDELTRYLQRHVGLWARRNRAAAQVPQRLQESLVDFTVVKSLARGSAEELRSLRNAKPRVNDTVPAEKIAELWRQVDSLRALKPYQGNPLAWRDVERRLLWLEQLAVSGQAYDQTAQQVLRELSGQLARAVQEAADIADRPALAARVSLLDPRAADWPTKVQLHSLPLCEYFGVVTPQEAAKLRQHLDDLTAAGDAREFKSRYDAALRTAPRPEILADLVETHELRLAFQYDVPGVWSGPVPLQRLLELRDRADRLTTGAEERSHYWTRHEWNEADSLRRQGEDRLFAGPEAAGPEPWRPAFDAFDRALRAREGWTARLREAIDVRERALAELPHWARLYASSQPLGPPVAGTSQDPIPADVQAAITATLRLGSLLDAIPVDGFPDVEADGIVDLATQLSGQLDSLRSRFETRCRELLAIEQSDASTLRGLELVAETPLVAAELRAKVRDQAQTLATRLQEQHARLGRPAAKDAPPPPPAPALLESSRDRVNSWPDHPLLTLLDLETPRLASAPASRNSKEAAERKSSEKKSANKKSDESKSNDENKSDDESNDEEEQHESQAAAPDQLAHWEQQAANVRQRLADLSRWNLSGLLAAAVSDSADATGASGTNKSKKPAGATTAATSADGKPSAESARSVGGWGPEVRAAREELSRAAADLRAAAALGVPAPANDPVRHLRHFDLQQLLLLHSRRALDDFWGAGRREQADGPPEPPFFARATRDHLRAAELVAPPAMVVQHQIADLNAQLTRRLGALADSVSLQVDTSEASGSTGGVRFRVQLAAASDRSSSRPRATDLPVGEATVFARQGKTLLKGNRALLAIPAAADAPPKTVEAESDDASGYGLQAGLVFRGHDLSQPLVRRGFGGVLTRYEPAVHESAQVALYGQRRQQASVVFVLDCSSSMSRDIYVEAIGAQEQQQPRLDVAKSVLQEFLEQIAERGDMRVGVRFFGHRVGWTRSLPVKVLTQTDYAGFIPNELPPAEDVELVLPLGRFGPVEAGRVVRLLPGLKPWGQSPLYLSLQQALSDFDQDRGDTDRSIVVITDGGNYQFTPASQNVRARPNSTLQQVLSAWRGRKIPVHIVGFGLDQGEPDAEAAKLEFQRIASATGGEYFPVESGQDLMKVLRARLGVGAYRVTDDRGASAARSPGGDASDGDSSGIRLNQAIRIPGLGAGPRRFRLDFESQSQPFVLEGGERLDFELDTDSRITTRAFNANVTATLPLAAGGRRVTARVHRPVSDRDGTTFRVSLQDESLEFLPRPEEVWVEITPIDERKGGANPGEARKPDAPATYVFYERNFEPQMPVPVVVCRVPNWPAGALSARIQVWCKYAASTPVLARPLDQIVRQADGDEESMPGVPGIRFRPAIIAADADDGLTELRITERHSDSSPGIDSLRIQLAAPVDLWPRRIERQADAAAGLVVHSFFVPRDRWLRMAADARVKLVVTTRDSAREGAFRADNDRAVTVEVAPTSDTLPIQPPRPKL